MIMYYVIYDNVSCIKYYYSDLSFIKSESINNFVLFEMIFQKHKYRISKFIFKISNEVKYLKIQRLVIKKTML